MKQKQAKITVEAWSKTKKHGLKCSFFI